MESNLIKSDAAWKRLQARTGDGLTAPISRRARMEHRPSVIRARRDRMIAERAGRAKPITNEPRVFHRVKGTDEFVEI